MQPTITYLGNVELNIYEANLGSHNNKSELLNENKQDSISVLESELQSSEVTISHANLRKSINLEINEKVTDINLPISSQSTESNEEKVNKLHQNSADVSAEPKMHLKLRLQDKSIKVPETEEQQTKVESASVEKFQNEGASIIYVHTFCLEIIGDQATSLLEKCRAEMKLKCDIDVLSWFKNNPLNSPVTLSKIFDYISLSLYSEYSREYTGMCSENVQQEA